MRIRNIFYILLLTLLQAAIPEAWAQQMPESPDSAIQHTPADIRVSMLTAMPGPEIYELYGHVGLRIIDPSVGSDNVYNYGVFDFNAPGFAYRFVKGETDYMVDAWPYILFMQEYQMRGSQVIEQELDLTPAQKTKLIALLNENMLPENRVYRYKYLTDNCSTRILDMLDEATDGTIIFPDKSNYDSWRSQMAEFNDRYPWYQFGIDLILGAPLDNNTNGREEMFMPVVMSKTIGEAHFSNGKPLLKSTNTVYEGRGDMRLPATPWYISPLFIFWLLAAIALACVALRRENLVRWLGFIWMLGCSICGAVVWYMIFISVHEASSPNILGLWAGPQCLVAAWVMLTRNPAKWMIWYMRLYALLIVTTALLALFGVQHINAAMWPVLLGTFIFTISKERYACKKN